MTRPFLLVRRVCVPASLHGERTAGCEGATLRQAGERRNHARNLVERDFKPILKRAGLPPIPFKNLRASHLSHLERIGTAMSVIQARAGHANPSTTLGHYLRPVADQQREAAQRVAADLGLKGKR